MELSERTKTFASLSYAEGMKQAAKLAYANILAIAEDVKNEESLSDVETDKLLDCVKILDIAKKAGVA